jgi:hypothetical protein
MTPSPLLMPQRKVTAEQLPVRLAWTTSTGDAPLAPVKETPYNPWDEVDFCFVCGRCTDHFGEHDDLVELGMVEYIDGSPRWVRRPIPLQAVTCFPHHD